MLIVNSEIVQNIEDLQLDDSLKMFRQDYNSFNINTHCPTTHCTHMSLLVMVPRIQQL